MNLKKVTALALVGAMALSLAACGSTGTTASTAATGAGASGSAASAAAAATSSDTTGTVSGAKGANQDAANTTATDETLTIGLASEPSALWGAPVGKTENEAQIIFSALTDRLVKVDHTTGKSNRIWLLPGNG
jgi:peptide/nickel transport system substrate-binding protein